MAERYRPAMCATVCSARGCAGYHVRWRLRWQENADGRAKPPCVAEKHVSVTIHGDTLSFSSVSI